MEFLLLRQESLPNTDPPFYEGEEVVIILPGTKSWAFSTFKWWNTMTDRSLYFAGRVHRMKSEAEQWIENYGLAWS